MSLAVTQRHIQHSCPFSCPKLSLYIFIPNYSPSVCCSSGCQGGVDGLILILFTWPLLQCLSHFSQKSSHLHSEILQFRSRILHLNGSTGSWNVHFVSEASLPSDWLKFQILFSPKFTLPGPPNLPACNNPNLTFSVSFGDPSPMKLNPYLFFLTLHIKVL